MSILIGSGTDKGDVFAISFDCETGIFNEQFLDTEAHMVSVTAVLADKNVLISAGSDGSLQSYSFETKRKLFTFDNIHETGITSLSLSSDKKFLITSADNGMIIIWKKIGLTWKNIKCIDKHKKSAVFSLHPSDKLGISISKDNTFRVWDIYNGKQGHKLPIRQPYVSVKISPSGKYYLLRSFNIVNIYDMDEAKLKYTIKVGGNIKDISFIDDSQICIAELKKITIFLLSDSETEIGSINFVEFNCKNLSVVEGLNTHYLVCTVSSNSRSSIHIYDVKLSEDSNKQPILLGKFDAPNIRITSISCAYK